MKKLIPFLFALLCSPCFGASVLLFTNKVPAETDTPEYYAGVQAIVDAINGGYRIHCTLQLPENGGLATFYSNVTDIKVNVGYNGGPPGVPNYVSAILDMRPHINNYAQALTPTPLVSGSMDSLGQYWYSSGTLAVPQTGYIISWWAD